MTSNPLQSIALNLLSSSPAALRASRQELRQQAQELARLLDAKEICPACWRLAANGTAGKTSHDQNSVCVWG